MDKSKKDKEKILADIKQEMDKMTPEKRLEFLKNLNECLRETKEAANDSLNFLRVIRDKVKEAEILKKIKE